MASKAQIEACQRYYARTKAFMRTYIFKVDTRKEPELAAWLDSKDSRAEYIRDVIRMDMERGKDGRIG